ncbi:MAG: hypothetical protein HY681_12325 [Chloroflexi bacterium]|nr:hypothetical protein [Chloroflexota bacterium]
MAQGANIASSPASQRAGVRERLLSVWRVLSSMPGYRKDLAVGLLYILVGLAVGRHLLGAGYPPGVDTPTFLHFAWFTEETLHGNGGWSDPYWYGGFPLFTTYPPLGYGVVGALAALPGVGLVFVYKVALFAAFIGVGYATYFLARQMGYSRPWAALAGALTLTSYPLLVAVGLWGWFASFASLALALLSYGLLERAADRASRGTAIAAGLALGASFLTHHMTAVAMAMGLPGWFLFRYFGQAGDRTALLRLAAFFVAAAAGSTLWWIAPWLVNLLAADFQREVPGLWSFPPAWYVRALVERDLIGLYAYPNYLGAGLTALGIGGILHLFVARTRAAPYAVLLLLLALFSVGEQANPLVRIGPLTGLDVARFQLYMTPAIALAGLPFVATIGTALKQLVGEARWAKRVAAVGAGVAVALLLAQVAWDTAIASSRMFRPYRMSPEAVEMVRWFGEEGREGKVLGVGFWNWDDFFLPYYQRAPVVDGWHDEGARNWEQVRALRMMMWTGQVDVPRAHTLLGDLDGRYIAVQDYYGGESPKKFREALEQRPELFSEVADWGQIAVFERVSSGEHAAQ